MGTNKENREAQIAVLNEKFKARVSSSWNVDLCAFLMLIIMKTGYTNVIMLFLTPTGQEAGRSEEQIESMKDKTFL